MKLSKELKNNVEQLKKIAASDDLIERKFFAGGTQCALFFLDALTDKNAIGQLIIKPLNEMQGEIAENSLFSLVNSAEAKKITELDKAIESIFSGETVLFVDGLPTGFSFGFKRFEQRAVAEPPTSVVVKGPREGFTENVITNIGLLRRKLKTPDLKFKNLKVGRYSDTQITLCYIDGVVQEGLLSKITAKLKKIDIDAVLDSSYISKFISQHRTSMFKQAGTTEKPDVFAAKILEGRLGILVDGSPIALTVPYIVLEDFQSPEDYYTSSYRATMSRIIRLVAVIIAVMIPALFVAAQLFHLQLLPLNFLLTIVNSIKGIPFAPSIEMFFILLIYEILNEASVRMPKYVGMVISIVGGLVLGETAVSAGIISAPALMVIALSGVCLYTVPELTGVFSLIRIIFLLVAGFLGVYGIVLTLVIFLIYLVSFENFNTPILAPYSPIIMHDLGDGIFKNFLVTLKERPEVLKSPNKKRMKIEVDDEDEGD